MHIAYRPRTARRAPRMGDAFDDLISESSNDINAVAAPGLVPTDSFTPLVSTLDPSSLITSDPSLTQFNSATSPSAWTDLLTGISKIAPGVTSAYANAANTAALQSLVKAQTTSILPASLSTSLSSITASPYFPYAIGGGFILLALSVLGGSSPKRRR